MKKQLEYILYELNSNYTEESSIDNINNISNINTEEINEEDENIDEEYVKIMGIKDCKECYANCNFGDKDVK